MEKPTYIAKPGSLDVVITHKYDAPLDLVYRTYVDPKLIPDWWGPRNLTTKVEKMDVRPGGIWRYIQHDVQNNTFAFHGVYHTIQPNKLIISTFEWEGMPDHVLLDTTRFEERNGKTIVTQQNLFQSVEDRDGMLQEGMEQGMTESDERFTELLARIRSGAKMEGSMAHQHTDGRSLTISRVFNAPPEEVWCRWTDPEEYTCWFGPKDYSAPYAKIDLRLGGKYLSSMRGPDGKDVWSTGVYKEIIEPNRLVMTDSFADEHGNVVPASYYGMGDDIPIEMEVEVTLKDVGGKTLLTLEHCGLPEGEIQDQTKQGWLESFDKLDACLS